MPRPKTTRPKLLQGRSRKTNAATTEPTTATAPAPAPAPEPQSVSEPQSNAQSSDIYDVSDREKERVAAKRKSLRDGTSAGNPVTAETIQQTKSLEVAKQRRDAAMERLANLTSTENTDEERAGAAQPSDGSPRRGRERRVEATPLRRRPADVSGLDLDDSMFDDYNTTVDTVGLGSAQRSIETSTLSVSQFRRRPRAGSFLSRDDGPIRPGSRGINTPGFGSTLNFGVFKRRAREPSILSTARKPRSQVPEPEQELEDDQDELDDEDKDEEGNGEGGFAPEAESTPLRRSKRASGRVELTGTSSEKAHKRKSTEKHERRLRSSPFNVHDGVRDSIEQPASEPASDEESLLSSPPPLPPSTPVRAPMDPALMAPPLSSGSSEDDEELWPPLKAIPKTRARPAAQTPGHDDVLDMSSPPSLTHSPNYAHSSSPPPARAAKPKRKETIKPPPKLTTAVLTGLLPRRRRRDADDDNVNMDDESEPEVDISGLGENEDELAHLDVRTKRRPESRANARNQPTAKTRAPTRNKDKADPSGPNKRISRTYGRLSDKENRDQEEEEEAEEEENNESSSVVADPGEEDSQMMVARMGVELKNAVRKFEEVDKWELSFEERTRSSSPLDAR
ncbi:hypothetical protein GGR50DRAFT_695618 [Xylaria sp. CBS 124048]|nr:hypothetical protein GGR50DRAFT_695618 [Xylaria sp. CBS 124048]